eukprot:1147322-Pelagomonas_calceolata.AAC.14
MVPDTAYRTFSACPKNTVQLMLHTMTTSVAVHVLVKFITLPSKSKIVKDVPCSDAPCSDAPTYP